MFGRINSIDAADSTRKILGYGLIHRTSADSQLSFGEMQVWRFDAVSLSPMRLENDATLASPRLCTPGSVREHGRPLGAFLGVPPRPITEGPGGRDTI